MMTYVVGLTGGIGSGKTTITQCFEALGVPVIDADQIAHQIVDPQGTLFKAIVQHFGKVVVKKGELNRRALKEIIFHEPQQKAWLENLLHPVIDSIIIQQIAEINTPYCIVVIPLLAEHYTRYRSLVNHILVVDADENLQMSRANDRDQESELISKIMLSQKSRADRLKIADTVLENNGSLTDLKNKIVGLHRIFLDKAL